MLEIVAIDHLVLRTTKLDQMIKFYLEVLGCTVERETAKETGLTQLRAGNALIDLVAVDSKLGAMGGGPPTKTERNVDHFCLQIKSMAEAEIINHLEKHSVEFGEFSRRYGAQGFGHSIYIQDPEANIVELKCEI